MPNDTYQRIRGVTYRVREDVKGKRMADSKGQCDRPDVKNPQIRLAPGLRCRERLEIILHEALHAAYWDLDEEAISAGARDIASLLWKMGYRRTDS